MVQNLMNNSSNSEITFYIIPVYYRQLTIHSSKEKFCLSKGSRIKDTIRMIYTSINMYGTADQKITWSKNHVMSISERYDIQG